MLFDAKHPLTSKNILTILRPSKSNYLSNAGGMVPAPGDARKVLPRFAETHWIPGLLITGVIFTSAWVTAVPGIQMAFIPLYAGYLNIVGNYLPKGSYFLAVLSIIVVLMIIVFIVTFNRWHELLNIRTHVVGKWGEKVRATIADEDLTVAGAKMVKADAAHATVPVKTLWSG
jgi:hypothetical protein